MMKKNEMRSFVGKNFRLLPVLVLVSLLTFAVRLSDAYFQVRLLSGSAIAQEKDVPKKAEEANGEEPPPLAEADAAQESGSLPEKPGEVKLPASPAADSSSAKKAEVWQDAADADIDYSNLRKELYEDLLQRRQQLDEKEKALNERAALLEAGEQEIGKKVQELTGLRNEIQDLLKQQSEEEKARISSLVKIYEGMKPKDAARIFNTLDTDILLDVVGKMSERKSAPIIASMEAERARTLTTLLAEQKKLPELPPEAAQDPNLPPPPPKN